MTEQYDEDLTNLTDPTPSDLSEESSLEAAIDDEDEDEDPDVEPGAEGPEGTGVEGADDILEEDRDRDAEDDSFYDSDYPSTLGEDDSAAAEQGNRDGDEMVSEGDDAEQVSELDGDTQDVDALGGPDEDTAADAVDLDGTDGGEDPLSGEALG